MDLLPCLQSISAAEIAGARRNRGVNSRPIFRGAISHSRDGTGLLVDEKRYEARFPRASGLRSVAVG